MDRVAKRKLSRFHHDFAQRWVSVDGQGDIFKRSTHFDCETQLGNQVGSFDAA